MDIRDALDVLRSGAAWRNGPITGDDLAADYAAIIWEDQQQTKPTLAECQQALLAVSKSDAHTTLNQWRGEQRAALGLTSAAFQELVYTGKALEAQRWLSDQTSAFALANEAAARGITNLEMANLVVDQWTAWQSASDQIEAAYVSYSAQIESSQSVAEIEMILSQLA